MISQGILVQGGGGYYTLTLPGQEPLKARGADGVMRLIKEHLSEAKDYVDSHGGFAILSESEAE